jgi:hypothetical protein
MHFGFHRVAVVDSGRTGRGILGSKGWRFVNGAEHAFLYSQGSMKDLGALAGGDETRPRGLIT